MNAPVAQLVDRIAHDLTFDCHKSHPVTDFIPELIYCLHNRLGIEGRHSDHLNINSLV